MTARLTSVSREGIQVSDLNAPLATGPRFDSSDIGGNGPGEMVAFGGAVKLS